MSNKTVGMNSVDFLFFCQEDVLTSQGLHSSIRFKTRHSVDEIREAMRYMLTVYPRLRSIIEPTLFSYRMRILDDQDTRVDVLFKEAFKVKHGMLCDTEEYLKYRRDFINESYALQQALPIKIRYIPDDPLPILFISVHHMIYDGSGWKHLLNSLLSYLNGIKPPLQSAYEPSLIKGFLARPFYKIPQQLFTSLKTKEQGQKEKDRKTIMHASTRPANFYGPVDVHNQKLSHDLSMILAGAKRLNCSMTVLFLTALVMTLWRRGSGDLIGIEVPIDLRSFLTYDKKPVFSNYVMAPMIKVNMSQDLPPLSIVEVIKSQLNQYLNTLEQKEVLPLLLVAKLSTFIGKKSYAWLTKALKERDMIQKTCIVSNLGNLDCLNMHGTKSQVLEATMERPPNGLLLALNSLNGLLNVTFTYQLAEFVREDIINIMDKIDRSMAELLDIK